MSPELQETVDILANLIENFSLVAISYNEVIASHKDNTLAIDRTPLQKLGYNLNTVRSSIPVLVEALQEVDEQLTERNNRMEKNKLLIEALNG